MSTTRTASDPAAAYYRAARETPLLTGEEEADLVRRWRENGDAKARDRLLQAHLRLVIRTAGQFKGYGMAPADLIAEGNLGLVRALDSFEPERGLRFSTYAQWWVRAAMFEHVLRFSTPVTFGLSAERKKLFFKLRSLKSRLTGPEGGSLSQAETRQIADELGVRDSRVVEMERLLTQSPRSLDMPVGESGTPYGELLKSAWGELSERERDIVAERTLRDNPLRLEDLAQRYGISRERVRQNDAAALANLKTLVRAAAAKLPPKPQPA